MLYYIILNKDVSTAITQWKLAKLMVYQHEYLQFLVAMTKRDIQTQTSSD